MITFILLFSVTLADWDEEREFACLSAIGTQWKNGKCSCISNFVQDKGFNRCICPLDKPYVNATLTQCIEKCPQELNTTFYGFGVYVCGCTDVNKSYDPMTDSCVAKCKVPLTNVIFGACSCKTIYGDYIYDKHMGVCSKSCSSGLTLQKKNGVYYCECPSSNATYYDQVKQQCVEKCRDGMYENKNELSCYCATASSYVRNDNPATKETKPCQKP